MRTKQIRKISNILKPQPGEHGDQLWFLAVRARIEQRHHGDVVPEGEGGHVQGSQVARLGCTIEAAVIEEINL